MTVPIVCFKGDPAAESCSGSFVSMFLASDYPVLFLSSTYALDCIDKALSRKPSFPENDVSHPYNGHSHNSFFYLVLLPYLYLGKLTKRRVRKAE